MLAIIGGGPMRFAPLVELYHHALEQFGGDAASRSACTPPASSPRTDEEAPRRSSGRTTKRCTQPHRPRARLAAGDARAQFEHEAGPDGALFVGSPETVAAKIAYTAKGLGIARFDLKISNGTLGHDHLMSAIELYGTEVAPRVDELLS